MMKSAPFVFLAVLLASTAGFAQKKSDQKPQQTQKKPAETEKIQAPAPAQPTAPTPPAPTPQQETHPQQPAERRGGEEGEANWHFDMTEVPPVVTHHEVKLADGRTLHYTATAGRLPIKELDGTIAAEVFFVAYTLDGQDPSKRPVTFAFNGGPGSASLWLHMGALGPRKVVLGPDGFLPPPPYRLEDNGYTPLDKTDLVLIDAIGTGYSRPANPQKGKKFWGLKGDTEAFGEFIRMYISRYERWSSPLYLFGESYGTTRSASVAGYLEDRGIAFNGIVLLSTVLNFETLSFGMTNDLPYPLYVPSYTMIAAYHHKLAADLTQDLAKTRAEVEKWASTDYTYALQKGDKLSPQERQTIINQLARYTGLKPEVIDQANLRISVQIFTHNLLSDQKLRVGRLDGRYSGPDPQGYLETRFFDPTSANTAPPFTAVVNDYIRRDLGYKTDLPYNTTASALPGFNWEYPQDWGAPEVVTPLRSAMVKDKWLKVLVMEGYYDLATPYFAANYTMDHMNLPEEYQKNISYATYDSGHMVYLRPQGLEKMKKDFADFVDQTMGK
ncbi:MAG TPA: peptidase S10 [Terriglobales bacterium]|nr:peptidase S10 [Terriglobales bacterium]